LVRKIGKNPPQKTAAFPFEQHGGGRIGLGAAVILAEISEPFMSFAFAVQ